MKKFKNQTEMFLWIWNNRPRVSELSGNPLVYPNHPKWHFQFLHVLSKGAYPSYKLNPNNILLGTPDEHIRQEEYKIFQDKKEELKQAYYSDPNIKH